MPKLQLRQRLQSLEEQAADAAAAFRGSLHALNSPPEQVALGVALRADTRAFADGSRTLEKLGAHNRIEALSRAGELGIL